MIKEILIHLGVLYDRRTGNQVPAGVYPSKTPVLKRADRPVAPAEKWESHTTEGGASFFQRVTMDPDCDSLAYDIRGSKPKGKTNRLPFLTRADADQILRKVKSISWDTAAQIKSVWAANDGKADTATVKALKGEMSERTVRTYTACYNAALSSQGEGEGAKPMQESANVG